MQPPRTPVYDGQSLKVTGQSITFTFGLQTTDGSAGSLGRADAVGNCARVDDQMKKKTQSYSEFLPGWQFLPACSDRHS